MNAKEFRLGNLIVYNGSVFKVTGITRSKITADRGRGDVEFSASDLRPLKITEYWMKKFIFDGNHWATKWILTEMKIPTGIENVHQLQNLYFDLVSEELEILND